MGRFTEWEQLGYTLVVFAKSAQPIEKRGDELPNTAKERSKSVQGIENEGISTSTKDNEEGRARNRL
jgi:hypothetical protein